MITFGSDPEFMIVDPRGNLRSAIGIVPGTKAERYDLGNGHAGYYDNVLAEVSIKPGKTAEEVVENFRDCFRRFAALIQPYSLKPQASATFPAKECQHDDAKVFGCDPEFDAYDVVVCQPPNCEEGNTFRSAGGHIHIGFEQGAEKMGTSEEEAENIVWNRLWVIRMCDLFIGVPSILIDHDPTSKARRKLYGGAGTHRVPPYGVEYRSVSNFWLAKPASVELMFNLATLVVDLVVNKKQHKEIWENKISPNTLRDTINKGNEKSAEKLLAIAREYMPREIVSRIAQLREDVQPTNFYQAWSIT